MRTLSGSHSLMGCLAIVSLTILSSSSIRAENVTSIEEDWQLEVDTPNEAKSSPQINCLTATGTDPQSLRAPLPR